MSLQNSSSQVSTDPNGDSNLAIRFNKDYNIIGLDIYSSVVSPVDLMPMMIELSYFEDIFKHFISGELLITDSQGLIEKLQLHGNEYIKIAFAKDGNTKIKIDKLFRVYKISHRQKSKNGETETYIIHFCSDEAVISEQYRVSKSYKGKTVASIINDLLTNHLKVPAIKLKNTFIEDTKNIFNFVVPNLKPFEAIHWLTSFGKSAAQKSVGNDMIFFENAKGYNFCSFQTLFQTQPYFTYRYNPKNTSIAQNGDDPTAKVFNVLSYEIIDNFDSLQNVSNGTYANRVIGIDPLIRQYYNTDFNYAKYYGKASSLNKNPVVNNLQNRFGDALYETPTGQTKLTVSNKNQNTVQYVNQRTGSVPFNFNYDDIISQRKSQLSLSNYTRLKISIAGDPNVTVGQTINFDLLSGSPGSQNQEKQLDAFYSGKYVVTAVRHMIQTGGYTTIMEITKDSVPTSYSTVDNTNPAIKALTTGNI